MQLINGDCLEKLKELPDNSVDSVVTDPPYGLSFMGKKWDYDVPKTEVWKEVYRVLKHGGHLLSFFGTRTYHRGVVNIEDAGFEIRDQIGWAYGSGFPKSHNIGKAVDKLQGNEREVLGTRIKKAGDMTSGNFKRGGDYPDKELTETKGNSPYEGWGTALKPAWEPIVVARKPLEKGMTVAENVLKWGTGGINIDGCRVETDEVLSAEYGQPSGSGTYNWNKEKKKVEKTGKTNTQGRFPANLLHDGSPEVLSLFPESNSGKGKASTYEKHGGQWGKGKQIRNADFGDSGSASRFFYCAKASKKDRNEGCEGLEEKANAGSYEFKTDRSLDGKPTAPKANFHPTVKPTALMQYLVRLVTPKGGTVLDPFMGSGSTGKACVKEGFDFIGIELDEEYMEMAKKRINGDSNTTPKTE